MPMKLVQSLIKGPPAYAPRTGWHALVAIPAAIGIFLFSAAMGSLAASNLAEWFGLAPAPPPSSDPLSNQITPATLIWILFVQTVMVTATVFACYFFQSRPIDVLALREPKPNSFVLLPSIIAVLAVVAIYSVLSVLIAPQELVKDIKPFINIINSDDLFLLVLAAVIGAPLSEEFLFRGFLLSALAKSKLGFVGAAFLTTCAWALLHSNYSMTGLGAVVTLGLTLSWLLWRTGSLWVPILCHAIYNGLVILILASIEFPT